MKIGDLVSIRQKYRSNMLNSYIGIIVDSIEDGHGYFNFNIVLDNNVKPEWYSDYEIEVINEDS
jgi:hypothetical protein|tara:strand:- start:3862 stop:4053 length:192 start_codon:yes stop_codon:yes gene_type:complete